MIVEIKAQFIRLIYPKNLPAENEFRICHYEVIDSNNQALKGQRITLKGYNFPAEIRGNPIFSITGQLEKDPKYGYGIEVHSSRYVIEHTKEGIIAFLSSGQIKGIGPATAKKIVDHFGEDTIKILEESCDQLTSIPGMTKKKISRISESMKKQDKIVQELISKLTPFGITPKLCIKIRHFYNDECLQVLEGNPYKLASDLHGIGFIIADKIAMAWGHNPNSLDRLGGLVMYSLERAESYGHSCLDPDELYSSIQKLMNEVTPKISADEFTLMKVIQMLIEDNRIVVDLGFIYRIRTMHSEREAANGINTHLADRILVLKDLEQTAKRVQADLDIVLAPEQVEAVMTSLVSPISVITGGPGTGKTTIINTILSVAKSYNKALNVSLLAPTGRAARRLEYSTGTTASTIHKALSIGVVENGDRDFDNMLDSDLYSDLVIIDESSMIDIFIAEKLLKACRNVQRLIFVGDVDQLPSVGAGNFLGDLISSGKVPVTTLTKVYRQTNTTIPINASRVKMGKVDFITDSSFILHEESDPEIVCRILIQSYLDCYKKYGRDKVCIILPMKKGSVSVTALNARIQSRINPMIQGELELIRYVKKKKGSGGTPPTPKEIIRKNDVVMVTRNGGEYSNGDVGTVINIENNEDNELVVTVKFDTGITCDFSDFSADKLERLTLAYAMTVHKSQGSEYDIVLTSLLNQHYIMLRRNLIYTCMTRAKDKFVFIGQKQCLSQAIREVGDTKRNSNLDKRIA